MTIRAYTSLPAPPSPIGDPPATTARPTRSTPGRSAWLLLLSLGAAAALLSMRRGRGEEAAGLGDVDERDDLRENPSTLITVESAL